MLPGVSESVTVTHGTLAAAALRRAIPGIPSFHSDRHNYGCPPVPLLAIESPRSVESAMVASPFVASLCVTAIGDQRE